VIWTLSANNTEFVELSNITSKDNFWDDPASVSAHANASLVYEYYRGVHGRNSIDGTGGNVTSVIHYGRNFDNAFWNGAVAAFGDGDGRVFRPLCAALDIVAHEFTHGVIEASAGLLNLGQSGALNESFADFFGAMVDRDDWLIGEDALLPGAGAEALRDMSDPGSARALSKQPSHMDQYRELPETEEGDYGGVHINSGIPSKAAYLISSAIGKDEAERIYYRALVHYITRNSQFADARLALIQAAKDIYGEGSPQVDAVEEGFNSVGITEECRGREPLSVEVPPVEGKEWIAFVGPDFSPGIALVGESSVRFRLTAAKVIHSRDGGYVGKLSVTRDGRTIWFVDEDGFLHYIDISDPKDVRDFYYPDLYIRRAGDIYNASVSPDGDRVALVSAYDPDPNIYITDGENIKIYRLYSQTYSPGVRSISPRFADVIDWSPDGKLMLYDAFYEIEREDGGRIYYWDFNEMELEGGEIFRLVPPPPPGIDIGNPQYGSLSPTLIAYNKLAEDADIDSAKIIVSDFRSKLNRELDSFGWKPSFSPDDSKLAYHRRSAEGFFDIYIKDLGSGEETLFLRNAGYPEWFVVPGPAVVEEGHEDGEEHAGSLIIGNFPNPFNSGTSIEYVLAAPGYVRLRIYDILGRKVATLEEGYRDAGRHRALWDGMSDDWKPLSSGIYIYTLERGDMRDSGKMVLVR